MIKPSLTSFRVVLLVLGMADSVVASVAQVVPPATLVLTEVDHGTRADAALGQAVSVQLRGNITTGYAWVLATANGDSIVPGGPVTYTPSSGGGVGVGGTFVFPFLAAKPDDTVLTFENRPPGGVLPSKTFTVTIHVVSPPTLPVLSVRLATTNVFISWPTVAGINLVLEGSPTLAPTQWAALDAQPFSDGAHSTVTLVLDGNARYFRLRQL